jgi:hypothetical protein
MTYFLVAEPPCGGPLPLVLVLRCALNFCLLWLDFQAKVQAEATLLVSVLSASVPHIVPIQELGGVQPLGAQSGRELVRRECLVRESPAEAQPFLGGYNA